MTPQISERLREICFMSVSIIILFRFVGNYIMALGRPYNERMFLLGMMISFLPFEFILWYLTVSISLFIVVDIFLLKGV